MCDACLDAMERLRVPVCDICGERLQAQERAVGERLCGTCRLEPPPFAKALAYGSYEAGLRELVQLLKYERVRPAANVLGRMLGEVILALSEHFGDEPPLVVPVPLHASKLRQRGFNQSEMIARAAIKNIRVPRSEHLPQSHRDTETSNSSEPLCLGGGFSSLAIANVLTRARETQSQTGLTPHQRRANVRGAFQVIGRDLVRGRDILLIDDVFTTGSTASECARVLHRAGAGRVLVATVARALKAEVAGIGFKAMEEEPARKAMAAHA